MYIMLYEMFFYENVSDVRHRESDLICKLFKDLFQPLFEFCCIIVHKKSSTTLSQETDILFL